MERLLRGRASQVITREVPKTRRCQVISSDIRNLLAHSRKKLANKIKKRTKVNIRFGVLHSHVFSIQPQTFFKIEIAKYFSVNALITCSTTCQDMSCFVS